MKKFAKVSLYLGLLLAVLLIAAVVSIFLFKDRIVQEFVKEANKNLNTPVKIGKIEISAWGDFPNLSIVFTDIYVEDSHPEDYPLLAARRISFLMNPLDVWRGKYAIRGLQVSDSEANLKINAQGKNNFTIVKAGDSKGSSISFDLKNVKLSRTSFNYNNDQTHQHHVLSSESLIASISAKSDIYKIGVRGDVTSHQIGVGGQLFFQEKEFLLKTQVDYNDLQKTVIINFGNLKINKTNFELKGRYEFKTKNNIHLQVKGNNANAQTLLTLLPSSVGNQLARYQSQGNVFFDMKVEGEISKDKDPVLSVLFGCNNATFFHPDYDSKIEHANLEGSFSTPSFTDLRHAVLHLKEITGDLNGKTFYSNLSIHNFDNPWVDFGFKGELDAASVQKFYPRGDIKKITGTFKADFLVKGELALLKKRVTAQQVKTEGTLELQDLNIMFGKHNLHFSHINGSLQFNNNDLAMSNLRGEFERSDFLLNGYFKNVITFLLFDNQPIGIEADLKSDYLDANQLLSMGFGQTNFNQYKFSISPHLYLNFNCDVKRLSYKRFHPKNITGNLVVKNQVAVSHNIGMRAMGGELNLDGWVDAKNAKSIEVSTAFKLIGIHIDSVFYVFENFYQDFVQDKHLRGQAFADVSLDLSLSENLKLISKTLVADVSATIKKGELNNFEPLKGLNKYLDDESLSKLRFADLKNDIHIEGEAIYIPQMEIKSNATVIQLSGTHSFDQKIDYRVVAPLRNKKKIDPDEAFGALEEDKKGQTKLYLKITGTTDKYQISYDQSAVKKKIISDLKKEVQELKDAFKQKGKKKKKELELEKDEYFDWENP
ncbi:MAG: AsmA-like C-terminal region-containing protein [Cytophagales bacterium]